MEELILDPYSKLEDKLFQQEVVFSVNGKGFQKIEFKGDTTTYTFIKCRFKKITICNSEEINFNDISINFFGCYIEEINIENIVSKNISVIFGSSILSGRIANNNLRSVSLNNCIIRNSLFLLNQNSVEISYTEENIFPKIWEKLLERANVGNFLDIMKLKQSFEIHNSKKINFYMMEKEIGNEGIYRKGYMQNPETKIGYYLSSKQKELLNIHLSIRYSIDIEDVDTRIDHSYLNSLSLSGYSNGNISIENTKIDNWYISDFSSQKEVSFYNICPLVVPCKNGKIEFHKSNLDKTWFDNINFSDYSIVSFHRTKFGKTIFSSCNFPENSTSFETFTALENIHYPEKKSDNYYKDQYEIFLQLKLSLENTGNFYESQKLRAISNDALKKIKSISKWDKSILWINSKSNNHGLSIARPLSYLLLASIIFWILYLLSLGRMFNHNKIDYNLIGYYFSFIDLTHRNDFLVNKDDLNGWSLVIDFINKLIVGFFTYQFIAAFRKYGKR